MKIGRNAPCPCGSGKKYKRCCLGKDQKQTTEAKPVVLMDPNSTMDEVNAELQRRMAEQKSKLKSDSESRLKTQMSDWVDSAFNKKEGVTISAPSDVSASPVMRYLGVILDEAMSQKGSFKVTAKGNLPLKVVKVAQALLPEFAVAKYQSNNSAFTGSNEERFGALRYARALTELAGIIEITGGRVHVKEEAQQQYQAQGLKAFFMPMLEAAVTKYDWTDFDSSSDIEARKYWLFMLWRLQDHCSMTKLVDDVKTEQLDSSALSCFVEHFLQYWGFVTVDGVNSKDVELQPLLEKAFKFSV